LCRLCNVCEGDQHVTLKGPSGVWFFIPILCNSDFQQLAMYKKLNPNRRENHLIEIRFCEDNRPNPQFKISKTQHSVLTCNFHRQNIMNSISI